MLLPIDRSAAADCDIRLEKAEVWRQQEKEEAETEREGGTDGPLLDLSDDAVKKMIKAAKKRGYVTMDELNSVLPSEEVTSEQIEDTMSMLSDMGINVVEDDEDGEEAEAEPIRPPTPRKTPTSWPSRPARPSPPHPPRKSRPTAPTIRCACICARWARSNLLSREGEIAIAKRIEAGRETMIAGLCESPLTFQAIIIWRDELNESKILLREIIDLEATYAGPEAKQAPVVERVEEAEQAARSTSADAARPATTTTSPMSAAKRGLEEEEDDEDEQNLSLAAMEAELRPQVMETLDVIADTYKKLRKLQDQQVENRLAATGTLSPSQERRYKQLKEELIKAVKSLSLNTARIEALVEQLYDINKRLVQNEGRLLRLAESYGVRREEFLKEYQGSELDPNWMKSISNLSGRGWKEFTKNEKETIREIRAEIQNLATETGDLDRRVPQDRQPGPEGRARSGDRQEGNGRGQPAPRHLDRQEIHQSRPAVPRSDPGRQYRPDEGGRQVRVPPRLQVLDLRDMVDQAGDHPLDRRPGAHHPHSGAHDRDDQQDRAHLAPDAARDRPRADAGGTGRKARHAARKGAQGAEDRQGADQPRNAGRRRGGFSHLGDFIEDKMAILPIDAAIQANLRETTTRVLASLTPREERVLRMRFGIGMNTDHTLEEVGQQFSVTRERIRQIEAKALRKLKHPSRSRKLRSFLDS